jgi:hypothetical protein
MYNPTLGQATFTKATPISDLPDSLRCYTDCPEAAEILLSPFVIAAFAGIGKLFEYVIISDRPALAPQGPIGNMDGAAAPAEDGSGASAEARDAAPAKRSLFFSIRLDGRDDCDVQAALEAIIALVDMCVMDVKLDDISLARLKKKRAQVDEQLYKATAKERQEVRLCCLAQMALFPDLVLTDALFSRLHFLEMIRQRRRRRPRRGRRKRRSWTRWIPRQGSATKTRSVKCVRTWQHPVHLFACMHADVHFFATLWDATAETCKEEEQAPQHPRLRSVKFWFWKQICTLCTVDARNRAMNCERREVFAASASYEIIAPPAAHRSVLSGLPFPRTILVPS